MSPMRKKLFSIILVVLCTGCTPKQGQVVIQSIDDAIKCIAANLDKDPKQIAIICSVSETPDLINLVTTVQAARAAKAPPKGPGL